MTNDALRQASRIYFDANVLIYFVERADERQVKIGRLIERAVTADMQLFISDIGVAECLYGAYKGRNLDLEEKYRSVFYRSALFTLVPVDSATVLKAAKLGARQGHKLIDAIHLLAAIETGCELLITNDATFKSTDRLRIVGVDQI